MADVLRPEVMLLDVGMPRMSGLDAARWVRQQPWGANVVLIAITGWGQADDRRGTTEAGFDEHLTKPVDPDELLRRLANVPRGGDTPARRATPR
jgi:DNA-binding response OmpR family regulator